MKKIIIILLCCAFVFSAAACGSFGKSLTEQYVDIVEDYEKQYGVISKERNIIYGSDALGGLSYIDLIDFNGDGIDELLLIFDQCTNEKVMEGALTCHIYADNEGKATLVYDENLHVNDDIHWDCELTGRTLLLSEDEGQYFIVQVEEETKELRDYPKTEYNYDSERDEVSFDYDFLSNSFVGFDGSTFDVMKKTSHCKTDGFYMIDDNMCTEQEYNSSKKDVTKYIECSTYFYDEILAHNNSEKELLGIKVSGDSSHEASKPVKPKLSTKELYEKYSSIIEECENTYGAISKPKVDMDSDPSFYLLRGVSYIDLIDFNLDGTEELVLAYYKPYDENYQKPYEHATEDGYIIMEVYAAQGKDIVNVFDYVLSHNDYRCLGGDKIKYGIIDNKVHIFTFMDYSLYMPEVELGEYDTPSNYNQWFTADCFYEYDGTKFIMKHKASWQGEGYDQVVMYNDEICTYKSDENTTIPMPESYDFEGDLSVDKYDICLNKISDVKKLLASGNKKEYISFDEQTKYSSYRELADYLLADYTKNFKFDDDGVYQISDKNITEKNGVVEFIITYTYSDKAFKEMNSPHIEKTSERDKYIVDLSTGWVYSYGVNDVLNFTYLW